MIRRPRVEGCRPQGGAIACNDWHRHNLSMNMETRRQQSCIQFTLRTNALIQDVNSAFSPDFASRCETSAQLLYTVAAPQI